MKFVARTQAARIRRLLSSFPAVLLLGPRQCGKSTLAKTLLPHWRCLDLERPADLALVSADIEGFLRAQPRHVVIDEAQRLPALFPALRHSIDSRPGAGRFLLTGSASPSLTRTISESLAGRVGVVELQPLSARELVSAGREGDRWFWGGYPPVLARRGLTERLEWLEAYVATFLERDLPSFGVQLPALRLRRLWTMLTHVHGSLLNASDLARSLAVSHHTVTHDLDVLEASFMVRRLPPFFANVQKRLTKSPKLYVRDTGLLHFLAGLRRPAELQTWPKRGHSFEGLVIEEIIALATSHVVRPEFWFWGTQAGGEVDLLIGDGRRLVPIEVKLGAAIDPRRLAGLRQCMKDLGLKRGFVVHTGGQRTKLGSDITIVPWRDVIAGREAFSL